MFSRLFFHISLHMGTMPLFTAYVSHKYNRNLHAHSLVCTTSVCVWWSPPKLFFNGHFGRPSSNSHQLKSRINYRDTLPAPRKNGVTLVAWGWERALLDGMATTTAAQEDNAELE